MNIILEKATHNWQTIKKTKKRLKFENNQNISVK